MEAVLHSPNRILFGAGSLRQLKNELEMIAPRNVLIVTSLGMPKRTFFQQILADVRSVAVHVELVASIKPEPNLADIELTLGQIQTKNIDLVIGLGGGSVMDTAKLISCRMANDDALLNLAGTNKVKHKGPSIFLIPTLAGSGSEITHEAIITHPETGTRFAIKDPKLLALCTLIDSQITASCSAEQAIISGVDASSTA